MKKPVIAIAVVVLVAAGIVLPAGYFGQVAERTFKERLANMPFPFQLEVVEYQRNWFSSTARLEWQPLFGGMPMPGVIPQGAPGGGSVIDLPAPLDLLGAEPLAIDVEIAHGPVYFAVAPGVGLFHARGRVALGDASSGAESGSSDLQDEYLELYVSSFSGKTVSNRLEVPRLDWNFGALSLSVSGAHLEGEWSGPDSFQLQRAVLESFGISVGAPNGMGLAMSNLDSRTEYPQGIESGAILAPSESTSYLGEFSLSGSDGSTVMRMSGWSSEETPSPDENGSYRGDSDATIESIEFLGKEFAPVAIQQAFGGINEAAFMDYATAVSGGIFEMAPAPQMPEEEPEGSPELQPSVQSAPVMVPQLSSEMKQAVRAILAAGPFVDANTVLTYQGEHALTLDVHMGYNGERVPAADELGNLMAVLAGLEYSLDFEMPVAAAEGLLGQGILQMVLMQGLLQQSETSYRTSVKLKNGMLNLNGMPMPLPLPGAAPPAAPPG